MSNRRQRQQPLYTSRLTGPHGPRSDAEKYHLDVQKSETQVLLETGLKIGHTTQSGPSSSVGWASKVQTIPVYYRTEDAELHNVAEQ